MMRNLKRILILLIMVSAFFLKTGKADALLNMEVKDYNINFEQNTLEYFIKVSKDTTSICYRVEADANNIDASQDETYNVTYSDGLSLDETAMADLSNKISTGQLPPEDYCSIIKGLKVGNNTITIASTQNGINKTYILNIEKLLATSDEMQDPMLQSLKIKGYNINFAQDTLEYSITVSNETESICYLAGGNGFQTLDYAYSDGLSIDEPAMVDLSNKISTGKLPPEDYCDIIKGLKVGKNTITIGCSAPNGNRMLYSLNIIREGASESGETVNVPDTLSGKSALLIILSITFIALGLYLLIKNVKKKRKL